MSLQPPAEGDYASLGDLEQTVQAHAKRHGYAVNRGRSRNDPKTNTLKKVVIECSRSGPSRQRGTTTKQTSTKKCDCPFKLNGTYYISTGVWTLTVIHGGHNHEGAEASAHFAYRNQQMTQDMLDKIDRLSKNSQ